MEYNSFKDLRSQTRVSQTRQSGSIIKMNFDGFDRQAHVSRPLTKEEQIRICWREHRTATEMHIERLKQEAMRMAEQRRQEKEERAQARWESAFRLKMELVKARREYNTTEIGRGGRALWVLMVIERAYNEAIKAKEDGFYNPCELAFVA